MAELLINGKDALSEWGVRMGDSFLDAINGYEPLKDYITNNDRTKDGVQYADVIPKVNERSITLNFTMQGSSAADFTAKNEAFKEVMRAGDVPYKFLLTAQMCTTSNTLAKAAPLRETPNGRLRRLAWLSLSRTRGTGHN